MATFELDGKFAVVQPNSYKNPVFVKLRQQKKRLQGIVQNNALATEPDLIELTLEEVLVVCQSQNPPPGKLYGCPVEPFYEAMRAEKWGNIYYYRQLADTEQENFNTALSQVYRKFIKIHKLSYLLPIDLQLHSNQGNMQGEYIAARKGIDHKIRLMPTSFITGGQKELQRLLIHELGHPLYRLYLSDEYKERWVRLYLGFNVLHELTVDDLRSSHKDFVFSKQLPSEYRKNLDEEGKIVFKAILKYIKSAHHIKLEHLDLLVKEKNNDLSKFWPKSKIELSEIQSPVSKYSGKNPTELFAESLSYYAVGDKLPTNVAKLVKRSLRKMQPS